MFTNNNQNAGIFVVNFLLKISIILNNDFL